MKSLVCLKRDYRVLKELVVSEQEIKREAGGVVVLSPVCFVWACRFKHKPSYLPLHACCRRPAEAHNIPTPPKERQLFKIHTKKSKKAANFSGLRIVKQKKNCNL